MKKLLCAFLSFFVVLFVAKAQTIDDYQRQQQAEINRLKISQQESIDNSKGDYLKYLSKRDIEWSDYLRKEWESFQVFAGNPVPEKPKPQLVPVCTLPIDTIPPTIPSAPSITPQESTEKPVVIPDTKPIAIKPQAQPEGNTNFLSSSFNYFGRACNVQYDPQIKTILLETVEKESIAKYWEQISTSSLLPTFNSLTQLNEEMNLNDYAFFGLNQEFASNIYPKETNTARLFTWFLMVQAGYGVRVGFQDDNIVLLLPTYQKLFENSYLSIDSTEYYIFPKTTRGKFHTYKQDYNSEMYKLDMRIPNNINFSGLKAERNLNFNYQHRDYTIQSFYDSDYIDFLKTYPFTDLKIYFDAAVSTHFQQSLIKNLKTYTQNMNEVNAVNFILNFVQKAFEYKTDEEQFGREKYFFAEELLYYPFSDCEDRSILFARLVKDILGMNVIGLEYKNHVATAVVFSSSITGDYFVFKNERYVISDPTYINAPVGMSMPQYKSESPVIIEINP